MEMLNLIQLISKFVSNSIGICMVNMSFSFVCFSNTELRKVFKTIRSAGRSNISRLMVVINSKPLVDLGEKIVEWRTNGSKPLKRFTKFHWPKNGLIILNIEAIYNIVKHYQKQGVIIKFQYEDDYSVKMARLSAQSAKKSKQLKNKKKSIEKLFQQKNGYIKVYVDGCCFNNGISNGNVAAGCGVVFNLKHSL